MGKGVSQAKLARRWCISKQRISQYCNEADPMPLDSEDAALGWLSSHYPDTAAKIIEKQARASGAVDGAPAAVAAGDAEGDGVEVLLARARLVERSAWKAYRVENEKKQDRSQAVIEARLKTYHVAADARMEMEGRYSEWLLQTRQMVSMPEVLRFLGEVLESPMSQLNALPYDSGPRANPTDPTFGIGVLVKDVGQVRQAIVDGFEKLKEKLGGVSS